MRFRSGARGPEVVFELPAAPDVTVVVIGWRDAPDLLDCLGALAGAGGTTSFEVVVTLNEPTAALLERLDGAVGGCRAVEVSEVNVGFGEANNRGAARGAGRLIAFLNDDATVTPGWLDQLVAVLGARPGAGAVGSRLDNPDGSLQEAGSIIWSDGSTTQVDGGVLDGAPPPAGPVDYCSAAALLVRRDIFESVGGFDAGYFPAYFEDTDLCLKVRAAGRSVVLAPGAAVVHRGSASTSSRFAWFLHEHNRRRFTARWGSVLAGLDPPPPAGDADARRRYARAVLARPRPSPDPFEGARPALPDAAPPASEAEWLRAYLALRESYCEELESVVTGLRDIEAQAIRAVERAREVDAENAALRAAARDAAEG